MSMKYFSDFKLLTLTYLGILVVYKDNPAHTLLLSPMIYVEINHFRCI